MICLTDLHRWRCTFPHALTLTHIWTTVNVQLWYGGAFYRQHLLASLVSLGKGVGCVRLCASTGNSPLDRMRQAGATGGFQGS